MLISRPFTFIIGPDEGPIVVHEAVLAEQSPALAALMRGEMAESTAGEARWIGVDKGTFVRFAQFAYTRDYSIPKGSTLQPPSPPRFSFAARSSIPPPPAPPPSTQELDDEWDSFRPKKGKKSKSVPEPPTSASDIFNSLKYPLIESRSNLCTCKSSLNDGPVESSSEVLLAHASLYVLAEKWGVNSLKILVLSKLHQTLSTLRLDALKVQVVIDLARYTYLDSSTPDLETEIDGLRKLICLYKLATVK